MKIDPIDAVITWVDGEDPAHFKKRNHYLDNPKAPGAASTRFASDNEIVFCVLSILKFAPFFRKIFIVTDDQIPPVFDVVKKLYPDQAHKIEIVDHKDIFRGYEKYLPTFNSISIEMMQHKIPGLAEKFVNFNDDVFLVDHVGPDAFFTGEKLLLRGTWMTSAQNWKLKAKNFLYTAKGIPENQRPFGARPLQKKSARLAGHHGKTFLSAHVPHPMRKKIMSEFEKANADIFKKNIAYRFRNAAQFIPNALLNHIELKNHNAVLLLDSIEYAYVSAGKNSLQTIDRRLKRIGNNKETKFLCVQSLDTAAPPQEAMLKNWLQTNIGGPMFTPTATLACPESIG